MKTLHILPFFETFQARFLSQMSARLREDWMSQKGLTTAFFGGSSWRATDLFCYSFGLQVNRHLKDLQETEAELDEEEPPEMLWELLPLSWVARLGSWKSCTLAVAFVGSKTTWAFPKLDIAWPCKTEFFLVFVGVQLPLLYDGRVLSIKQHNITLFYLTDGFAVGFLP